MDKNEQIARNAARKYCNYEARIHENYLGSEDQLTEFILAAIKEAINAEFIDRWNDIERLKTENQRTKQT